MKIATNRLPIMLPNGEIVEVFQWRTTPKITTQRIPTGFKVTFNYSIGTQIVREK